MWKTWQEFSYIICMIKNLNLEVWGPKSVKHHTLSYLIQSENVLKLTGILNTILSKEIHTQVPAYKDCNNLSMVGIKFILEAWLLKEKKNDIYIYISFNTHTYIHINKYIYNLFFFNMENDACLYIYLVFKKTKKWIAFPLNCYWRLRNHLRT